MNNIAEHLSTIGSTASIQELNASYSAVALSMDSLLFDGIVTRSEMERTLNHIANYNIVRVANKAYEDFIVSGRSDTSRLFEIEQCRSSLKDHDDAETEQGLLDNLCAELDIN